MTARRRLHPAALLVVTMKLLVLVGSLVLNLALAAALALHPDFVPPVFRDFLSRTGERHPVNSSATHATPAPAATAVVWSTLDAGGDLAGLVARLRAAGYPAKLIRAIVSAQVSARYDPQLRVLNETDPNTPFWKLRTNFYTADDPRLQEMNRLQRERSKLLRELFADPFFASGADVTADQRRQFGNLSPQKIDLVQRIEDDYAEMTGAVRAGMGGITLPEDREKLALLAREKRADLAAVLTPDELADYEMRSSPITNRLRSMLGGFDASEAEYRAIYQAQLALNQKSPTGIEGLAADYEKRQTVQADFYNQIHTALGDARYGDYIREIDREFQQLSRLAGQNNLAPATAMQAYNFRDNVATESNRIFDDATLSADDKRAALQSLAQSTRAQLLATLGPTVGPAYVKIAAPWLTTVEAGSAVNFTTSLPLMIINDQGNSGTFLGSPSYRRLPPKR